MATVLKTVSRKRDRGSNPLSSSTLRGAMAAQRAFNTNVVGSTPTEGTRCVSSKMDRSSGVERPTDTRQVVGAKPTGPTSL